MSKKSKKKKTSWKDRKKKLTKIFWWTFWLSVPLMVIFVTWVLILTHEISDKFRGKTWDLPSKVYSDSLILYPGIKFQKGEFEEKLKKLEYAKTDKRKLVKGNYRISGQDYFIYLHDFEYPREKFSGFELKVSFDHGEIIGIEKSSNSETLYSFQLEPELIAEIFSKKLEERKLVRINDLPEWLPNMLIFIEDRRFYDHFGLDFKSIARAFVANIKQMRIAQGGSTITQQLIRNFFLTKKQTLWRKFVEAIMAVIAEVLYSKEEILESYMNEVWLGQKGSVAIHGFGEASRFYFGKDITYINALEGAMLVGMVRSASVYSPYRHFERSEKRAKLVFDTCYEARLIPPLVYQRAKEEKIEIKEFQKWSNKAPYFTAFIQKQLLKLYSEDLIQTGGLKIFTTIDMDMQRAAQEAISKGLAEIEKVFPHLKRNEKEEKLQSCIIAVKPQTGFIKAYIGGRDFVGSQFERISMAKRQPGSLFKPFVYMAAFELDQEKYTPATILDDSPLEIKFEGQTYKPRNYEEKYYGDVTLRRALESSLNSATIRVGHAIGEDKIVKMAKRLGITSELKPYPSIAIGSFEVTPLEMAQAYSIIANMGTRAELISIRDVVSKDREVLEKKTIELERIVDAKIAFVINYILKGVLERGSARAAHFWGFKGQGAGKTGTTDDYRDSWFVGYTPELLSLSWVGFDKPEDMKISGSAGALRIWSKFMGFKREESEDVDFRIPDDIVFKNIDSVTGLLAGRYCKDVQKEAFIKGTEPTERTDCKM